MEHSRASSWFLSKERSRDGRACATGGLQAGCDDMHSVSHCDTIAKESTVWLEDVILNSPPAIKIEVNWVQPDGEG